MRFRTPIRSQGEVETITVSGGFSTVVKDDRGHAIEPKDGHGYFDADFGTAQKRHIELAVAHLRQVEATEARAADAGDD